MNQQHFRKKLQIRTSIDPPLIPKIQSMRNDQPVAQETNRKRFIKGFSPQRFQLPQITKTFGSSITPVRQRGQSVNFKEQSSGFLGPLDFARLQQIDQQSSQDFCYFNNCGNPYEWKVVRYQERKENYYMTISNRGIIIHHSDSDEFVSIKQFENERNVFYQLQNIEFFRNYLKQKTFSIWKKQSIKNKAQSISQQLISNYLLLDPSLKRPIEEINKYICIIRNLTLFQQIQIGPLNQTKFANKLNNSLSDFQKQLQKNLALISKIAADACQYSFGIFKEEQGYRQNLELIRNSQMEQKPIIIGDNSTQSMQYTMESNLKQFQQKLIKFTRTTDFVILECLIVLMETTINRFLKVVKNANQHVKAGTTFFSWVIVDIHLKDGQIQFEPSKQILLEIFVQTIQKGLNIIENSFYSVRKQPDLQNFGVNCSTNDLRQDLKEFGQANLIHLDYTKSLAIELDCIFKQISQYLSKISSMLEEFKNNEQQPFTAEILKEQFWLSSELQSEIEAIENQVDIGFLRLNVQIFKQQIQTHFKGKIRILNERLIQNQKEKSKALLDKILDWLEKLKLKPVTLKQYVLHQDNYQMIKNNFENVDQMVEEIHMFNRIYGQQQQVVPQIIKELWDKILSQFTLFQYKYYDLQNQYGLIQDKFEKDFRRLTPLFHQKVLQFCEQFESNKDINDLNSIQSLQGQLQNLEQEYQDLQQYSKSLQIEFYFNEQLSEIQKKYKQFRELQVEIHKVKLLQQEWMREHFLDLKLSDIKETYRQLLKLMENCKIFGQLNQIKQQVQIDQKLFNVIEVIIEIKDYDQNIVSQVCKKDKQLDKGLLQLIMQICNNPQHPTFTTQYLNQYDINDQLENLQQLLVIIQYENQTMNQLLKLEEFWKLNKLVVQKVMGTKDQYQLNNLIQLNEQLDENILTINNILGQPNIEDLKQRIDQQLKNIVYLQEYIEQLIKLQDTQNYLTNVLSTQINQKNQSKEMKMYQQQEKQWKQLVRLFQQQKSLEIWVKDEGEKKLLKQITQDNVNCKQIIQQLHEQFEKKKYLFPRFNFLSSSQFSKVVSEVKHPAIIQKYLSLFFQNIHQFDYDTNKEAVTSLYSKENDQIPLKYCPMKGEIEDWFRTIEDGMKIGLRQIIKNALKHTDNLNQFPIQVIFISLTINYTIMLEDTLQNEEKDWSELVEFKQYEISEQSKQLQVEKQSIKQQLRQIAIILILNQQFHQLQEINHFKVTNEKDYFYVKQFKYIYDDENVMVNFLNQKIQYQFEFFGDEFNCLNWKQQDQAILSMNQAFQIGRLPHFSGDETKYYITTQYSQMLGRYYKQLQIKQDYDIQYLLQCVYGAIQSNSLLMISGFQNINQEDQLILISIFKQIAAGLLQQIQISDLEGRQIRLQNRHFISIFSTNPEPILHFKNFHVYTPNCLMLWQSFISMIYQQDVAEILQKLLQALINVFGDELINFQKLLTFNQTIKTLKKIQINDLFEILQQHLSNEDKVLFMSIVKEYFNQLLDCRYPLEQLINLLNDKNLILVYGKPNNGKSKLIQELFHIKIDQEMVIDPNNPTLLSSTKYNPSLSLELQAYNQKELESILLNTQNYTYFHFILSEPFHHIIYQTNRVIFFNQIVYQNKNIIFESSDISTQEPTIVKNYYLFYYDNTISNTQLLINELKFICNSDLQQQMARNLIFLLEQQSNYFTYSIQYIIRCLAKVLSVYYNEQLYSKCTQLDIENICTYTIYILFNLILDQENRIKVKEQIEPLILERKLDQLFNQKKSNQYLQGYFTQQELYVIIELQCNVLFYGNICCNKSVLAQMKSQQQIGFYFHRESNSMELQDFLDKKLMTYRKDRQLQMSPPFGQIKHFLIEDINMSNQCNRFLKQIHETGYMFDKKTNWQLKYLNNIFFVGTSQQYKLDKPHLYKHFMLINCNRQPLIQQIYTQQQKVEFINDAIIKLNIKLQQKWESQYNQFYQYLINQKTWQKVLQPLQQITDPQQYINLFYLNVMRVYGSWMDIIDQDYLDRCLKDIHYDEQYRIEFLKYNYDEVKKQNNSKLFLHESNLQKIIHIMRGWEQDQHIIILGKLGSGRNSFIRLAQLIMGYEQKYYPDINVLLHEWDQFQPINYITKVNDNIYQYISYPIQYCNNQSIVLRSEAIKQFHISIIGQDFKEFENYGRLLYKCQIIKLFDWPRTFLQDVASQIIADRQIDGGLFCKLYESQSQGYIRQFLDSLNMFSQQFQQSKADNQRLIIIYSKVLTKIEEANEEFIVITNQYNQYTTEQSEVQNQINFINSEVTKDKLELGDLQQQIVKFSDNISKNEQKYTKQQSQLQLLHQQFLKQRQQLLEIFEQLYFLNYLQMELVHLVDLQPLEQYQIDILQEKYPQQVQQIQNVYQIAINISVLQSNQIQLQNNLHNDKVSLEEIKNKLDLRLVTIQQQDAQVNILSSKLRIINDELEKINKIFDPTNNCLKYLNKYQVQWQQNIFNLQQQQMQQFDYNFVQCISQTYHQQIKSLDHFNLQCKIDNENMQLILNLKYQNTETPILIIDPENLVQDYIFQYYPTAQIETFQEDQIIDTDNQQCIIIKDVNIEQLLNSQLWRTFLHQSQNQRIYFISHQIRLQNESQSLIRTIYYKKTEKEIESNVLLNILQVENPDLFDRLLQQYDEENLSLINLGQLLDDDRPIMDQNYEQQLSLLISSQFNSIINLDVIYQIQELIDQQEQQKENNNQFNFEVYHPLIVRFLLIYRGLQQSYIFDRRYYITIQQLLDKLLNIITQIKGDSTEKYWIVSNHFTQHILSSIEQQCLIQHHLIIKFLVFTQIDLRNRTISNEQYQYILGQKLNVDLNKYPKYLSVQFVKQDQWDEAKYIMSLSPSFEDLHSQINRYPKEWQRWLDDTNSMPAEYEEKLQIFEKLILIKAFKPKYFYKYIGEYVKDRSMRHSSQIKLNKSNKTTDKQILFVSIQYIKQIEELNLPIYKQNQELNQEYLFYQLSQYPLQLQEQILQSKYPHIIIEMIDQDLLLDKTLLNCQKQFLQYHEQIRMNMKQNIPKVQNSSSELKKYTYSLCYMHFFMIQKLQLLNRKTHSYGLHDLQLILKHNINYYTNGMHRIITDGIYNIQDYELITVETIINKYSNILINTENYQYLHFQTLPIGSDVWLDEMINRIPDTNDTYSIGYGLHNFIIIQQQNQQIIKQFDLICENKQQIKEYQYILPDQLALIKIEQKLTRKNSFHKNDSKPFSSHYRKTAQNIINKNKQNISYIDAIDQYINIQITKYNTLLTILKNYNNNNLYLNQEHYIYLWYKTNNNIMLFQLIEQITFNLQHIKQLRDQQNRKYFDLSCFYIPQALFEYFKIQFSRKNGLNVYNLNIYTDISKCTEINQVGQQQLNDGTYLLGGLECINCQWSIDKHKMIECLSQQTKQFPFILVTTLEGEQIQSLYYPIMDGYKILLTIELQSDLDQDTIFIREAKIILKGRQ